MWFAYEDTSRLNRPSEPRHVEAERWRGGSDTRTRLRVPPRFPSQHIGLPEKLFCLKSHRDRLRRENVIL